MPGRIDTIRERERAASHLAEKLHSRNCRQKEPFEKEDETRNGACVSRREALLKRDRRANTAGREMLSTRAVLFHWRLSLALAGIGVDTYANGPGRFNENVVD